MSSAVQKRPSRGVTAKVPKSDRPVSEIISRARTAPAPVLGAWLVTIVTAALLWCSFYPLNAGPLAWLAPVPLLLLVRLAHRTRRMYLGLWLGGLVYWTPTLQWMRLGDVAMIPAWLALAVYLALYFPIMIAVMRVAVHRLQVPLAVAAPTVWVAGEYLRSHLMSGFGWYLLGHSQHEFTSLTQICDLSGVYGVSFLVLLSAAALTECVPAEWFTRLRLLPPVCEASTGVRTASSRRRICGVLTSILLVSGAVLYGSYRLEQADFTAGPRVALIQGDFQSQVKHDPNAAQRIYQTHFQLTGMTVKYRPDVIIWPETMFPYALLQADPALSKRELADRFPQTPPTMWTNPQADVGLALRDRAEQAGAPMIVGLVAQVASKTGAFRYNSAAFVEPDLGITGRYDKIHLVPFGEYVPLQKWLPFLAGASPYGTASITPGDQVHVFNLEKWRLLPLICFEDTVPHLVRQMVRFADAATQAHPEPRPVDCLVNLTNDGWFRNSSEQEQHLITATFRCIETRTPMVRAVNTGISAVIDGNGVVRDPVAFFDYDRRIGSDADPTLPPRNTLRDPDTGRFRKSLNAAIVADVPLDARGSLYLWWGDWFAAGCLVLTLAGLGWTALRGRHAITTAAPAA